MNTDAANALKRAGHTLYITLGNDLRSDDGIGKLIAENTGAFHAGTQPENAYYKAIDDKPDKVVFIDAADFGETEGEIRLINPEEIFTGTVSTHKIPLSIVAEMIKQDVTKEVYIIGIQIKKCGEGQSVSVKLLGAVSAITKLISK